MTTAIYPEAGEEIEVERGSAPMPPMSSLPRTPLASQIEELFSRAEPRLRRLARARRVAPDAIDDVIQETLIVAWKSLEQLRDDARFAAWLDGICRNICLRYQRKRGVLRIHETPLNPDENAPDGDGAALASLADPDTFDPVEELTQRDMGALLDRALDYLSPESRIVVERHYLGEIPQRELAAQLGLSLSALEARLHRARGQMLRAFSHELREEALALGLAVTPADAVGWRETRITCFICGRARMLGKFAPMDDGRVNMQLRCSACQPVMINSLGIVDLAAARSFLPATRKIVAEAGRYFLAALAAGGMMRCWACGQPTILRVMRNDYPFPEFNRGTWLQSNCGCIQSGVFAISPYGALPEVRDFLFSASAIIVLPETEVQYNGQHALRFGALSPGDGRRLSIFANSQTLAPFAVIIE
jgi:RNA polymerase sigma-70 factor (ECF subfamily)